MYKKFKAVSLSHKSASVAIRELVALDEETCRRLLKYFKEFTDLTDVFILSTCNRTEVYYSHELDLSTEIIKLIGMERGLKDVVSYLEYFKVFNHDLEAIQHLFRVSMGLEAQVVGDMQISNQVKRAYQASADLDMAGPFLHRVGNLRAGRRPFRRRNQVEPRSLYAGSARLFRLGSVGTIHPLRRHQPQHRYRGRVRLVSLVAAGTGSG